MEEEIELAMAMPPMPAAMPMPMGPMGVLLVRFPWSRRCGRTVVPFIDAVVVVVGGGVVDVVVVVVDVHVIGGLHRN
jgi:tellurite resistance protein TehA-like permease